MKARTSSSIELLETRIAPAVVFALSDLDGDGSSNDLTIKGSSANEIVLIDESNSTTRLSIDVKGDGDFTDVGDTNAMSLGLSVRVFQVNLGAGNDTVTINQTANLTSRVKSYSLTLGPGNNAVNYRSNGFLLSTGTDMRIDIQGGSQNDALNLDFGDIAAARLAITGKLRGGRDAILTAGQPAKPSVIAIGGGASGEAVDTILGSSVHVDMDLGTGGNLFRTQIGGVFAFVSTSPSTVDVQITGSSKATDIDDVTVDFADAGIEATSEVHVGVRLLAGNDKFTGLFDFTGFRLTNSAGTEAHGGLVLDVDGGAGNDTLSASRGGTTGLVQLDGLLDIILRGNDGNDTITADLGTSNSSAGFSSFDDNGAQRSLRLFIDGGAGNDILTANLANNGTATFAYDILLLGQGGNDTLSLLGSNSGGGTPTYGGWGGALLDGGLGIDTTTVLTFGGFIVRELD